MKKLLLGIVIIAIVAAGAFFYFTRKLSAPVVDVSKQDTSIPNDVNQATVYRIDQDKSTATFKIGEVLRGEPNKVIGTTHQVGGDVQVSYDANNKPVFTFGMLSLNAKTFVTDSEKRDAAIVRFILKSEAPEKELIKFVPKTVSEVTTGPTGKSTYTLTGDLTINGITKTSTFTILSYFENGALNGTANMIVKRSDFNLVIPSLDFIATVDNEVEVTLDIVADAI